MSYYDILDMVTGRLIGEPSDDDKDAAFNRVFDSEVVKKLAYLSSEEYAKFKIQLAAWLITKPGRLPLGDKAVEKRLDKLVVAARERLKEKLALLDAVSLGECMDDCPAADQGLNIPPGWHLNERGLHNTDDEGGIRDRICSSKLYISGMTFSRESKKSFLELAVDNHGWHYVSVPASATDKALCNAVKNIGVIVYNEKLCAEYLRAFFTLNHQDLQVKEHNLDLFGEFIDFYFDNIEMFNGARPRQWGKLVYPKEQENPCLAVLPKVLRAFAKQFGVSMEQLLLTWEKEGRIVPDAKGNLLKPVKFQDTAKRMVVLVGPWVSRADLKVVV